MIDSGLKVFVPVQCVAHLYSNEYRQSHGHRVGRLKDRALHPSKLSTAFTALQVMGL